MTNTRTRATHGTLGKRPQDPVIAAVKAFLAFDDLRQRVNGSDPFPTNEEVSLPGAAQHYALSFRGGITDFHHGPDLGNWEVAAHNADGDLLWSVSGALWNSFTFGQARIEAHQMFKMGEDDE